MSEPAILLAAGPGTRLRPLTDSTPKCLVPVGGRAILDRWVELLVRHGISRALVTVNHLAEQVEDYARQQTFPLTLDVVREPKLLGTAGVVRAQRDWLAGAEAFWVVYTDSLSSANLSAMRSFHRKSDALGTLGVYRTPVPQECGIVRTAPDGRIVGFVEKPTQNAGNLASGGLYLLSQGVFDFIPENEPTDFARDVFPRLLDPVAERALYAWRIEGYHLDIGTIQTYCRAERDSAEGRFP